MPVLKELGQTDVITYYSKISANTAVKRFLKGKKIATKILLPKGIPYFIKRGSKEPPLYIEEISKAADSKFLELRKSGAGLSKVKDKMTVQQQKVWDYMPPRKLLDLFYATNNEGAGRPLERLFFDIDLSDQSPGKAQQVAASLASLINKDREFRKKVGGFRMLPMWSGASFHIYLLLKKKIPNSIYDRYIHFSKNKPLESFTGKWADEINRELGSKVKVVGGHKKEPGRINIDPSQSPSGKLARAPFSLHMKDAKTVDGIAIPLTVKMLEDGGLVKRLKNYSPDSTLKDLSRLARRLP
jgi:hypothetical protein